ncbi:terpene synthase family protein [Kitasatospora sp. NPDC059146]|uniref:terpene synthase family protein n=1 Tax=Kitasatospora sp. NPDC059146 TaxID=3346741 RepID=UPI003687A043
MPQDAEFFMPYPRRSHPDTPAALERNIQWARQFGPLPTDSAVALYAASGVAEFGTDFCTEAGDDVDLLTNGMAFHFIFDDFFDTPSGQPADAAVAAALEMADLLGRPALSPRPPTTRIGAAFARLWADMTEGRSAEWSRRAARSWLDYLYANLTEEANRRTGEVPTVDEHLEVRRHSIAVRPTLHLLEAAGRFEVPSLAWHSGRLTTARRHTVDHVVLVNEVTGLEKDEARGEPNLVQLVMAEQGRSRDSAIRYVIATADEHLRAFLDLHQGTAGFCDRLGLSGGGREAVHRHVDNLRDMIAGNYYVHTSVGRYGPAASARIGPDAPGLLGQDGITPS